MGGFWRFRRKVGAVGDNPDTLVQLLDILSSLVTAVGELILWLGRLVFTNWLLIVWIAWWLWGVNWNKTWQVLARGAWVPVALLMVVTALVWSEMTQGTGFLWRFGEVCLVAAVTLFCGWLQGVFGWTPAEIDVEPRAGAAHDHATH